MQDLDSAVGRLDNILMSVYVIVAILIIAVALVREFSHHSMCIEFPLRNETGDTIIVISNWCWNSRSRYVPELYIHSLNTFLILFIGLSWLIGGSLQEVLTSSMSSHIIRDACERLKSSLGKLFSCLSNILLMSGIG